MPQLPPEERLQRPIALAAIIGSVCEMSAIAWSQEASGSSAVPLQSSSKLLPGKS